MWGNCWAQAYWKTKTNFVLDTAQLTRYSLYGWSLRNCANIAKRCMHMVTYLLQYVTMCYRTWCRRFCSSLGLRGNFICSEIPLQMPRCVHLSKWYSVETFQNGCWTSAGQYIAISSFHNFYGLDCGRSITISGVGDLKVNCEWDSWIISIVSVHRAWESKQDN